MSTAARALVLLGLLHAGCSNAPSVTVSPRDADPGTPAALSDPLRPGASLICQVSLGDDGAEPDVGVYVLSAMNHKLAAFPEFAAAAGLDLVRDCDSVGRYLRAYIAYSGAHPAFDVDEPPAPAADDDPPPPDGPAEQTDLEVPKIYNAVEMPDDPVVSLEFDTCQPLADGTRCPRADTSWQVGPDGDLRRAPEHCSGTFIGRQWILTAAHCITYSAIDMCMNEGKTLGGCSPSWNNYGRWRIKGTFRVPTPSGGFSRETYDRRVWAEAYVMPGWSGMTLTQNSRICDGCYDFVRGSDNDIAILHVSDPDLPSLPPRVEDNAGRRIAKGQIDSSWSLAIAGWGLPTGSTPTELVLRRGVTTPGVLSFQGQRYDARSLSTSVFPCRGDSGGPLLRTGLTLDTNRGSKTDVDAIIGVLATSSGKCDGTDNGTVTWRATAVDTTTHMKFIHDTLKMHDLKLACTPRNVTSPSDGSTVEECWGKPCTDGNGCATTEYCSGSPRETALWLSASLPACTSCIDFPAGNNAADEACNCVEGQCLPK